MKYLSLKNPKGFTLIETLFAVLIFSSALVALMTIAGRGISAANSARQQTVAHYLAQEGLEVARNVRDTNFVSGGSSWDIGLTQCQTEASACAVVYATRTLIACGTACLVKEAQEVFTDQGTDSQYTRKVYVLPGTPDADGNVDEYEVVSKVTWMSRTILRTVTLKTIIKKWQ
jgi:prepilin-type N-terminal cleavage/methylation domain-containing protein